MSFMSSRLWAIKQVLRGISRAKGLFTLAFSLVTLTLTIPVFVLTVTLSMTEPLQSLPVEPQITVFTDLNISKANKNNLIARVKRHAYVAQVQLIGKEQAFAQLNENLGLKKANDREANPLPDLLIVTLDSNTPGDEIEKTAQNIEKLKGVDMVAYDSTWVSKLEAIKHSLTNLLKIFTTLTGILSFLVVTASVRLAVNPQKNELATLYLFGAAPSFSRRPYAWRGFLTMGLAAYCSVVLSNICTDYLNQALVVLGQQYHVQLAVAPLPGSYTASFVVFCAALGGLIANIITHQAMRKIEKQ